MSISFGGDGVDDPSDFQALAFQQLDEHLRCPICKEFFDTTMILSNCSHSFCALCIRRSLTAEQICPKCRKPASDLDLLHNYDLDHVVGTWKKSRSFILDVDIKANTKIEQPETPSTEYPQYTSSTKYLPIIRDDDTSDDFVAVKKTSPAATRRSTRLGSQPQPQYNEIIPTQPIPTQIKGKAPLLASNPLPQQPQPIEYTLQQYDYPPIQPSPHQQFQSNVNQEIQPNFKQYQTQQEEQEPLKSTSMVECPVCTQKMKFRVLDIHLDRCMRGDSRIPEDPSATASSSLSTSSNFSSPMTSYSSPKMTIPSSLKKSKPIDLGRKPSKVVYAMHSDKDIRKILKDLGLPDHGDRNLKIWRHKEYINLYNANFDSQSPVNASTLVQKLATIEQSYLNDKNNQSKRKTPDSTVHLQRYKSEFQILIEDAKKRSKKSESSSQNSSDNNNK